MLTLEIINDYNKLDSIKEIWNELLRKSKCPSPYLTYQWFKTASECQDRDKKLHIIVVKSEEKIIAIAPFLISKKKRLGISINRLCFIRNANTPFQDFILADKKDESIVLILDYLKENSRLWNIVELDEMRSDSDTAELLKKNCSSKGLFYFESFKHNCWYLPIASTWEEGLAKLKSKTKKEFKRKLNRLGRLGELRLDTITEIEQIHSHLKIMFDFHEKTWKGKEKNSEFYYKIAEIFSMEQNIILYTLHLNNKPIAYLYCVKMGKILYGLKTTYDPSYYAFSPGIILFYKSIEHMYNQIDIEEFEIGRGEERFKKEWPTFSHRQIISYLGNRRLVNSIYFILKFKILPYCRREFFCKYLIPVFKKPIYILIIIHSGIKVDGFFKFLKSGIDYIKLNIYKKVVVDILKLTISIDEKNRKEPEYLFYRFAGPDDQDRLAVAMNSINLKQISQRFEKKDKCLIVYKNKEILHYFWFTYNEISLNEINESLRLKNDQVFLYDHNAITNTEFNNVFQTVCQKLALEDMREILTALNLANQDVGKNLSELGFKKCNRIIKRKYFKKIDIKMVPSENTC